MAVELTDEEVGLGGLSDADVGLAPAAPTPVFKPDETPSAPGMNVPPVDAFSEGSPDASVAALAPWMVPPKPEQFPSIQPRKTDEGIPDFQVPANNAENIYAAMNAPEQLRPAPMPKPIPEPGQEGVGQPMQSDAQRKQDWLKAQFGQEDLSTEDFLKEHPDLKYALYGMMSPTDMPLPRLSEEDAKRLGFGPTSGAVSGAQNAIIDAADFMTSAPGVITAITGGVAGAGMISGAEGKALAEATKRAIAYTFAVDMARQAPEQMGEVLDAIDRGDTQAATRGILNLAMTAAVLKHGGEALVTPEGVIPKGAFEKRQWQGPLQTGAALRPPATGGTPVSIGTTEAPGIAERIVNDMGGPQEDLPGGPLPVRPPRGPIVPSGGAAGETIPEPGPRQGPAEPPAAWDDFVADTRRRGRPDMTIAEVQAMFPDQKLNREGARRLLRDAFPEDPEAGATVPEPTPPPVPAEPAVATAPVAAPDISFLDKPMGSHGPDEIASMPDDVWGAAMRKPKGEKWSMTADATAWARTQESTPELLAKLQSLAKADYDKAIAAGEFPQKAQWYMDAFHAISGDEVGRNNIAHIEQMAAAGKIRIQPARKPVSPAEPAPVPEPAPAAEPAKRRGGGAADRTRFDRETETHGHDILAQIADQYPLMSKTRAKAALSPEKWTRNKGDWDDAPKLSAPHHNVIYASRGGFRPDQVAQWLYDDQRISDPTPSGLWRAIELASKKRAGNAAGATVEAKWLAEDEAWTVAWQDAQKKGKITVPNDELAIGGKLVIDGSPVEVEEIDPDTNEVTLNGGKRFGRQPVLDGESIKADSYEPPPDEPLPEGFGTPPEPPVPPVSPKLRPGEKGTGNLLQGPDQPFNLAGEEGTDAEKIAAAKAKAEKDKAEAAAIEAKQQQEFPAAQPPPKQPFFKPEEQARVDELKRKIAERLKRGRPGGVGSSFIPGVDPELFNMGADLAVEYLKAGVRKFSDFAQHMIKDLGEDARGYLLSWYNNARLQLKDIAHELDTEPESQRQYDQHFAPGATGRSEVSGSVRGGGTGGGRPGIRISRKELIPEPRQHVDANSYAARSNFRLDDEQVRGINLVIDRFLAAPRGGFVLADGTGFGKTAQMLAIADQYIKKFSGAGVSWQDKARNLYDGSDWEARTRWLGGDTETARAQAARAIHFDELNVGQKRVVAKNLGIDPDAPVTVGKKPRVLVVTQNKQVVEMRFKGDAARMGIDPKTITLATYSGLSKIPPGEWDLVIFDEAHNLKNSDAQKSVRAARLDTKHTLFGTATPMDKPTGAAYFLAEITGKTEQEIAKDLGYTIVQREDPITHEPYDSAVLLPGFSWPKVWANIMAHRDAAISAGAMIRREYPFYGDAGAHQLDMSMTDKTEHDLIAGHIDNLIKGTSNPRVKRNYGGQKTLQLSRWAEQAKIEPAVKMALEHLKTGGQVIIVAETDKAQSFWQPVRDSKPEFRTSKDTGKTREVWVTDGAITKIKKLLEAAGITDIADIHDPKANDIPLQVEKFQSGKARVALATPQSGGTGIDLDDQTGKAPRLMIALSKNMAGDNFEQLVGRVSRKNTKSPSQVVFLDLQGAFGDQRRNAILATKVRTLKAIQGGEDLDTAGGLPKDEGRAPSGGGEGDLLLDAPTEGTQAKASAMKPKDLQDLIEKSRGSQGMMYSGIPIPHLLDIWDNTTELVKDMAPEIRRAWRSFSMQSLPRITDASREAGEAGVRYASSPMVARAKGLQFASDVTEGIKDKTFDKKFGTGLTEDNLRDLKRQWNDKADEAENRHELIDQLREQISERSDDARDGDPVAVADIRRMRSEVRRLSKLTDADIAIFRSNADAVTTTIGAEGSPFPTEQAYRAFMDHPQTQEALRRHIRLWATDKDPLFREAADIDPDTELPTRGLDYGARVNLKNLLQDQTTPTTVRPAVRSPLIRATATLKRSDPFAQTAMGSGNYEGSYAEIMANGYGREYPVAKQHEFIRLLIENGDAKVSNREFEPEMELKDEGTKGYPLRLKPYAGKFLQIRKSLAPEYEDATGLRASSRWGIYSKASDIATKSSVQGLAEGSTHVSNLLTQLFVGVGPTANPMLNAVIKSAGRADILYSLPKILVNAFSDRKADMIHLAEIGAAKEPYKGAVGWLITKVDHGIRLYSADIYKKMAAKGIVPDTETGLREFVNQVGQYNKRLQPRWIQDLRTIGIQPFATAMQTFNVQGLRTLTGSPGIKASSNLAALGLRVDKAASLIGFGVLVTTLNYLVSGTAAGPQGTRLGAVGWIGDDHRLHQFDLGSLTGINRGARITGLQGYVEARRQGLPQGTAILSGAQGAANTAISAATGPLNRFGFMAATGKRPAIPTVQEAQVMPPQSDKNFNALKTQAAANVIEALKQSNPLADFSARMYQGKRDEAVARQFSRYFPKTGMDTETIKNLPKIVKAGELKNYAESIAKEARRIPIGQRSKFIMDRLKEDEIDPATRENTLSQMKRAGVFKH